MISSARRAPTIRAGRRPAGRLVAGAAGPRPGGAATGAGPRRTVVGRAGDRGGRPDLELVAPLDARAPRRPRTGTRTGRSTQWSAEIDAQLADDHSRPWIVARDGEPVAYVEVYRAGDDLLAEHVATDARRPRRPPRGRRSGAHRQGPRAPRCCGPWPTGSSPPTPRASVCSATPRAGHDAARAAFAAAGFALAGRDRPAPQASGVMARDRKTAA